MDNNLLERVKAASQFQNAKDIKVFEEGVWKLAESQDEETFKNLIELFDDETPYPEVMFNLVHALESYPDEKYVCNLISNLNTGLIKSPEFYAGLFVAAINNKNCLSHIKKRISSIDETILINLQQRVAKISQKHSQLIHEFRDELH